MKLLEENQLDGCINAQKVKNPENYGVIVPDSEGLISKIVEKPQNFISNIAVSGAYYFRKKISAEMFDMLEEQSKRPITNFEEHNFTTIIQKLILNGYKFGYNLMERPVLDFGRPKNLLQANKAIINEFFEIKNCIGQDSQTINSKIGDYTTIGNTTILENCSIENSIIGDNCNLKDLSLKNAIVG